MHNDGNDLCSPRACVLSLVYWCSSCRQPKPKPKTKSLERIFGFGMKKRVLFLFSFWCPSSETQKTPKNVVKQTFDLLYAKFESTKQKQGSLFWWVGGCIDQIQHTLCFVDEGHQQMKLNETKIKICQAKTKDFSSFFCFVSGLGSKFNLLLLPHLVFKLMVRLDKCLQVLIVCLV